MLLNNIYYFDQQSRAALYRDMGELLTERGQLLIVSMMAPGSVAAAHLHFMLTCQAEPLRRCRVGPRSRAICARPDSGSLANQVLVPTEPFIGLRAIRR